MCVNARYVIHRDVKRGTSFFFYGLASFGQVQQKVKVRGGHYLQVSILRSVALAQAGLTLTMGYRVWYRANF